MEGSSSSSIRTKERGQLFWKNFPHRIEGVISTNSVQVGKFGEKK